jgi:hypothetical protein
VCTSEDGNNFFTKIKFFDWPLIKLLHMPVFFLSKVKEYKNVSVPDKRSWILEVVIVRHLVTWVLGIWRGEGLGKG